MRLIGNKTRLLDEIEAFLRDEGVLSGTLIDIFAGTSSVGARCKERGMRVIANDQLANCYAQAVARIEVNRYPSFRRFRAAIAGVLASAEFRESFAAAREYQATLPFGDAGGANEEDPSRAAEPGSSPRRSEAALHLAEVIHYLNQCLEPREGLIFRAFCPGGEAGRRYFTDANGRRIDAILECLRNAYRDRCLNRAEFYLLLRSLLDAVDRVANISGTYGAYLKAFQANARSPIRLQVPDVISSELRHRAYQEDAQSLIRRIRGDVLYIDPPYNQRQYAANYHVLQIIAEYHEIENLTEFESRLYGKTGLRPYAELRSRFCVRPSRRAPVDNVYSAMSELVHSARVSHVLVSYSEEGLLSKEEIGAILARFSGATRFDFDSQLREIPYRRFRSDSDRNDVSSGAAKGSRAYRVLPGRGRDELCEWLFFASRVQRSERRREPSRIAR